MIFGGCGSREVGSYLCVRRVVVGNMHIKIYAVPNIIAIHSVCDGARDVRVEVREVVEHIKLALWMAMGQNCAAMCVQ